MAHWTMQYTESIYKTNAHEFTGIILDENEGFVCDVGIAQFYNVLAAAAQGNDRKLFEGYVDDAIKRACLISSAPDLLEALKEALGDMGVEDAPWYDKAIAAIAKAESR